jgi:hypothetical protein
MLKFCGKFLGKPSAYIFNKSLTVCEFPGRLKYSVVNLLFKKRRQFELSNYRPVSLLIEFSKTC